MFSTYQSQDVTILLKDITGLVTPLGTREREARIQSGVHYSEMLPLEYEPSPAYLAAYHDALERYAGITAEAVARAAEQIWESRGRQCALVSLARAGTPIGILIRRYLQGRYGADLPYYTISIIRGRGIDRNAMAYLLDRHAPGDIQFVDGLYPKDTVVTEEEIQNKLNSNVSDEQLYTVQTGDTPDGIAAQYGISVEQLRLLNPNLDDLMYTGNQVRVAAQERGWVSSWCAVRKRSAPLPMKRKPRKIAASIRAMKKW